ncbi:MAG: DUF2284 domain-containing protein [Lachnospiraceae bacterium]|nr:DUF2284 domain-containing protein [Lachnospiraceae bacterium]
MKDHWRRFDETFESKLECIGITSFGYVRTADLHFFEEIRAICAGNQCRNYGKTWACPPAVGTLEECRSQCLKFSSAMVFSASYPLEDSFDYEGMVHGHRQFKQVCDNLHEMLDFPHLLLSNEGCVRCQTCTYPNAPCRFPEKLFPSLEGYGILVSDLAKSAEMPYIKAGHVTYFGLLCYDR